ncbi:MAG: DUF2889 domain-containing protein [Dehalococcoidia bacterium]|nr:DUF2889 domain-containing protein [Dehalococcoidia bacterium]
MNENIGNGELSRNKQFSITGPEDGVYRAQASLQDSQHKMEVSLAVGETDMEVLEVKGSITKSPHDVCADAVAGLQALVGMRIKPGLFAEMQKRVGGAKGCIHMNELIREAVQLVAAHRNLTDLRRMKEAGRNIEEILRWADEVRSWTCVAAPGPVSRR